MIYTLDLDCTLLADIILFDIPPVVIINVWPCYI